MSIYINANENICIADSYNELIEFSNNLLLGLHKKMLYPYDGMPYVKLTDEQYQRAKLNGAIELDARQYNEKLSTQIQLNQAIRVYIAGPMSGYDNLNYPAFHKQASILRSQGFVVTSPAEITVCKQTTIDEYREIIKTDLKYLVSCNAIWLLSGWNASKGARLEAHVAAILGLKFLNITDQDKLHIADMILDDPAIESEIVT